MLRWSRSIADRLRSRLARILREDDGSASLEFLTVGLLMLVPLIYVVALGQIQHQALGAEAAARHVARAISLSSDAASAGSSAFEVQSAVMAEYDLDASATSLSISCVPASATCPTAGATVRVSVATRVPLPFAPPVLGLDQIASVPVEASAVQRMSRFWSGG